MLTGSVEPRKNPPAVSSNSPGKPGTTSAASSSGTDSASVQAMTRRGPKRSANGPPANPPMLPATRYAPTANPASDIDRPRLVISTGRNVEYPIATTVLTTTADQSRASGIAYGLSAPNPVGACACDRRTSGTRLRIQYSAASAGSASQGVRVRPKACT